MRKIKEIVNLINSELNESEKYAKLALKAKTENDLLIYNESLKLSAVELSHAMEWHDIVVKVIENEKLKLKEQNIETPAYMIDIWNEKHEEYLKRVAELKYMLDTIK